MAKSEASFIFAIDPKNERIDIHVASVNLGSPAINKNQRIFISNIFWDAHYKRPTTAKKCRRVELSWVGIGLTVVTSTPQ